MEKKRKGAIDLLRIIAATLIVLHHYQQGTGIEFRYISFWGGKFNFGYIVEFFFIISGILTCRYSSRITNILSIGKCILAKLKRIIPLLAISVVVETILRYVHEVIVNGAIFSRNMVDVIVNLIGIQSWGIIPNRAINQPTWYLSVLLMCYICFFLLTYLAKKANMNNRIFVVGMIALGVIINTCSIENFLINQSLGRGYFSFFLGVLLGEYIEKVKSGSKMIYLWLLFPILFLAILINTAELKGNIYYLYSIMMWIPLIIIAENNTINELINGKWIEILGKASFSVYVWNEPLCVVRNMVATLIPTIDLCSMSFLIIFIICNWTVGIASFYLFEINIDKFT